MNNRKQKSNACFTDPKYMGSHTHVHAHTKHPHIQITLLCLSDGVLKIGSALAEKVGPEEVCVCTTLADSAWWVFNSQGHPIIKRFSGQKAA